jgi:hypothetical protein
MSATKEDIIELLRERIVDLCRELLSGGKQQGHEWICGSVNGEAGKSMHVELRGPKTGMWNDHAGGGGGDVLKLIELNQNLPGFKEAMDWARSWLDLPPWTPDPSSKPPFDPLRYSFKDRYGSRAWTYRDADGNIVGYVVRFDNGDAKDIIPLRIIDGQPRWKGWTGEEKKPIYGVEQLKRRPKACLLLVEGEKTADAARKLFPDRVVLTWQGGSKAVKNAAWEAVIDHIANNLDERFRTPEDGKFNVVVWPDADVPGRSAAKYLKTLLNACHVVETGELPDGWDLADEPPADIDLQAMVDAALLNIKPPKKKAKEKKPLVEEELVNDEHELQGDLPELEEMELPEGVEWRGEHGVQHEVSRYNMFFHKNALYSKRVSMDKYNNVIRTFFHPIANFHIKILQLLEDEKESQYLLRVTNKKGRTRTFHTGTDFMLNSGNLKKALLAKGDFRYNGNEREADFERLQQKLLEGMGDGQKIDVLGWQEDTRVYAMNNVLITTKPDPNDPTRALLLEYDEFGSTMIDGKHYYVPSANKVFAKSPYKYLPQKRFRHIDSGIRLKDVLQKMREVHREHGMIGMVFMLMAVNSSRIYAHHDFVPMGYLYGVASTGKSKLSQAMQKFLGDRQEAMQVTGKSTDKAKIRKFAQLIDGLVVLEEFSNSIGDNGIQWLKGLNDRNGYERGTIDSNFGTDNVPITSAVLMTGNDYPQDDPLLTRLVVIEMLKNDFTQAEKDRFGELADMMEKGYSCVLREILLHRDALDAEYKTHYKDALADMGPVLTLNGITVERMIQNCSILMAVYRFFETRIQWPMTRTEFQGALVQAMLAQNNKRDTGGEVAKWWDCIKAAIKKEELVDGEDYRIDKDSLYIRFNDCYEQYCIQYGLIFRGSGHPHAKATMRTKLEKSMAFKGHVPNIKGFTSFPNGTSAYHFSMEKIGEEFITSVLMKRKGKYKSRGPEPPPDPGSNGHANGSNGPVKPPPGPDPFLVPEEQELEF